MPHLVPIILPPPWNPNQTQSNPSTQAAHSLLPSFLTLKIKKTVYHVTHVNQIISLTNLNKSASLSMSSIRLMNVRLIRCSNLLQKNTQEHLLVSSKSKKTILRQSSVYKNVWSTNFNINTNEINYRLLCSIWNKL